MRVSGDAPKDAAVNALPRREEVLGRARARVLAAARAVAASQDDRAAMAELLAAASEFGEVERRDRSWLRLPSVFPSDRSEGEAHRECRCAGEKDRRCLRCGLRACRHCQPESGGGQCRKCGGPVWADDEERVAARPNPEMGRY